MIERLPSVRQCLGAAVAVAVACVLEGCEDEPDKAVVVVPPNTTSSTSTTTRAPRIASFMVLGDWGWDPDIHGDLSSVKCQKTIADSMHAKMAELGDVQFVINVGDSFYPNGVSSASDPQWDTKWRNIYSKEVRSVPWYSVYGNHDTHGDNCTCSDDPAHCAQINGNISDTAKFYLPNHYYHVEHNNLNLEVVALDFNYLWANHSCQWSLCPDECPDYLRRRQEKSFDFFYERMATSQAKNMVVFSHYPSDYFWAYPKFLEELRNDTRHHVEFYGGHRHNVDQRSVTSIAPNSAWVVGGGGGWGCEGWYGEEQGFLVGEVHADHTITTYPVLVNYSMCCGK